MVTTDTGLRALALRNALVQMTIRYGGSIQRMTYAESGGRREEADLLRRARQRRFAAIQRLADALVQLST